MKALVAGAVAVIVGAMPSVGVEIESPVIIFGTVALSFVLTGEAIVLTCGVSPVPMAVYRLSIAVVAGATKVTLSIVLMATLKSPLSTALIASVKVTSIVVAVKVLLETIFGLTPSVGTTGPAAKAWMPTKSSTPFETVVL